MPFEALEARTAAAALRHIGNANVVGVGGSGRGIFDAAAERVLDGLVQSVGPVVQVSESDFPEVDEGAALTVRGLSYVVTRAEPDGTGLVLLQLRLAS